MRLCEYCARQIAETDAVCPYCGAPVSSSRFAAGAGGGGGVPRTIEELRAFCRAHHLPLEQMRFFIGEDYRQPRAFGIYQDRSGDFVVYKNKSDGSRAVRYQGPDEAHAVREIYEKMKSEIGNQRARAANAGLQRSAAAQSSRGSRSSSGRRRGFRMNSVWIYILIFFLVVAGRGVIDGVQSRARNRHNGYYVYQNDTYYRQGDDWYRYDDDLYYWLPAVLDTAFEENYEDYYEGPTWSSAYGGEDFTGSSYYVDPDDYDSSYSSSDSSWDDDYDWDWDSDYDSWDSGSTDWDSDW